MAGLLDSITGNSIDDPRTIGLLALASQLSSSPKFIPGLANGLLQRQQVIGDAEKQDAMSQMQQLQLQQAQAQMADQQRQRDFYANLPSPGFKAGTDALAGGGGPTVANAQRVAPVDPMQDQLFRAVQAGVIPYSEYLASQRKDNSPLITKAGDVARDPRTGAVIWQNEDKDSTPSDYKLYQLSGAQHRGMSFDQWDLARRRAGAASTTVSYGAPVAGVDAKGNPVFFQPSKDGSAPAIVPGVSPAKPEKALTEGQAKSAAFASQMRAAEREMGSVQNFDTTSPARQVEVAMSQGLGNFATSADAQRMRQAQEQWAESYLRFKTGAAATTDEVKKNVATFFPQPGDRREVIEQKRRARELAAQDVELGAGNAKIPTGIPAPSASAPFGLSPDAIDAEIQRRRGR